jgi:acyl-coenzyme A thioesterase PaaI-like protein
MGLAWAATLADGETFTTLELEINFLKPVWTGELTATGHVVVRASSTVTALRGEQAAGR